MERNTTFNIVTMMTIFTFDALKDANDEHGNDLQSEYQITNKSNYRPKFEIV